MSEILLIEIEFNSKNWYLSEEGYIGEHYYAPYLSETPSLELGEVKGGYIGVRLGDLSIANRPNDRFSPFSIFGGGYAKLLANPNQKIPVQIYWQQNKIIESIFDGSMYLSSFNTDSFNFLLEDKIGDIDLLSEARDFNSDFVALDSVFISGLNTYARVFSLDHGLKNGDKIKVSECTADPNLETYDADRGEIVAVEVTVVDDDFFEYTLIREVNGILQTSSSIVKQTEYLLETYTKKPQPFSFGVVDREKDIIQIDEKLDRVTIGERTGFEYSNPDLYIDNNEHPLRLFDDGVLVGTIIDTRKGNLATTGIGISQIEREGDYLKVQTTTNHGLIAGSTVSITGMTPDEVNTTNAFYVVTSRLSNTIFKVYARTSNDFTSTPIAEVSTGSGKVQTPGEYYGVDRLPTNEIIYSRAFFNDLESYDPNDSTTIRNYEGTNLTSFDGSVIFGTPLVSGLSRNGRYLSEFFEYIARKVSIDNVDFSSAPDASSLEIQLWETSQTKAIEYAGEIAYAANHLFEIKNNILRVIDRSYTPDDFFQINNWEIVEASYKMPTPVKALRTKWTENVANPKTIPTSLTTRQESVLISNMDSGEIVDITNISRNTTIAENLLLKIRSIINKNIITLKVGRIRSDIKVGSRLKANRDEDGLTIDMIVRTISYDFKDMNTEFVGDGSLVVIEQDTIY